MKKILFAGVALLAAVPVLAQPAPEGRGPMAGPLTRNAVQARVEARFARADANRDGFVTQDEIRARAEARRGEREAARGERRGRMFDRLDANHDGSISRAEFDARPAFRGGERGERGEGRAMRGPRDGGRFAHRGPRRGMMGMGGRGFAAMDLDHDGRIARGEAERSALERFDRVDTNRDGTISPEERQAAREAFRDRMQERQGQ
ncbi:MAG: EF-hand domain-containing protein [Allosphingosinicella sp.]